MSKRIKTWQSVSQSFHHVSDRNIRWNTLSLAFSFLLDMLLLSSTFGQTVVGTITRPGLAPDGLAVYEAGNKLCVFDDRTNHLLIYDCATFALKKEIIFGKSISDPFSFSDMVVNEAEGKLYICIGTNPVSLAIVNLNMNSVLAEISLPNIYPQSQPRLIYDQTINKIFVDNLIVDLSSNAVTKNNLYITGVLNPITHEIFQQTSTDTLMIINLITNQVSEVKAIENVADMMVNWLENKVYLLRYPRSAFWIYDRDDGSTKTIYHENDSESLYFSPGGNRIYTSAEIACRSTVVDCKSDNYFYLPMEGGAPKMGFRYATKHAYFVGNHFIAVLDETTQMLEKIDFDHPHAERRSGQQHIAVNQTTGLVFVTSVMFYDAPDDNPIWILQDSEMMTRPNVLLGGDLVTVLDPENYSIQDYWGVVSETGWGFETVEGITYNPDGSRAYVVSRSTYYSDAKAFLSAHAGSGDWDKKGYGAGNVNAKVGSCDMYGQKPITPVPSPDGKRIYVTCAATNRVRTVDVTIDSNMFVINEIDVGNTPRGAALTPDGAQLYVANQGSNSVSVINTASSTVTQSIPVGMAPWGIAINPSGTLAYVANSGSSTVSIIDIATNSVITNIQVGSNPHWLSFTPDEKFVYVTNNASGTISVIDAGIQQVVQTIIVGSNPEGICFYPDGNSAYVATNSGASIIHTSNFSVDYFSDLTKNPFGEFYGPYHSVAVANPTARFAGRVRNSAGIPVVGALVRVTQSSDEKGTTTTNTCGDFSIFNLLPGTYDIEVTAENYSPQVYNSQIAISGRTTLLYVTLIPFAPETPSLVSPQNNAVNQPPMLTLNWQSVLLAETYYLQVAADPQFNQRVVDDSTLTAPSVQVGPLSYQTTHYWHVHAKNAGGRSPWSDIWNFTVAMAPPHIPTPVTPPHRSENQRVTLTLSWSGALGADSYHLQVAMDSLFKSPVINDSSLSDTSRQIGPLLNYTTYFWHIRAKNAGGITDWSVPWRFRTVPELPAQVIVVAPPDQATIGTNQVVFIWRASQPIVQRYWFECALDSDMTNPMIDSTIVDTTILKNELQNQQTYWWRVKARNTAGWGVFSNMRCFQILITSVADEYPRPLNFWLSQNYPNPFNPNTVIQYSIPKAIYVELTVFDLLGRKLKLLVTDKQEAGIYQVQFDSQGLPAGLYFYRLRAGEFCETKKMVIVK